MSETNGNCEVTIRKTAALAMKEIARVLRDTETEYTYVFRDGDESPEVDVPRTLNNVATSLSLRAEDLLKGKDPDEADEPLKPCPFCGSEGKDLAILYQPETHVWCKRCGARSEGFVGSLATRLAAQAWNRRAIR